jgi:DNA-binding NarL/FixJ family response regulator
VKLGIISPRVLIRRALSTLFASTGVALVVLEADSLPENLEEIKRSQTDTLIVDACGPGGVEALSGLRKLGLDLGVVVLMEDLDEEACARALRLGAWGCLSTRQSPLVFQKALSAMARGERWMPQESPREIIEDFLDKEGSLQEASEELTPREWEVLGLLANGFRNKEIASRLSISEETAKSHSKAIYRKLKIKGRRDAIFRYFEHVHHATDRTDNKVAGRDERSSSTSSDEN